MTTVGIATDRHPGQRLAMVGAGIEIAFAIALGLLRSHNASIGERRAEGVLPTLALVAAVAAPGLLAMIGVIVHRPLLWGVAAAACLPVALVSIAAFPILIPAVVLLVAFARGASGRSVAVAPTVAGFVVFIGLVVVALATIVTRTGTYSYSFPNGGAEGGDYFLPEAAAFALGLVVGALALTTAIATRFTKP